MWKKWFPWRSILTKIAKAEGFIDPIAFLGKLQRFAQPSEVAMPVEIIRLAMVLQARGLINVQAIQHNLDWIWPYWVVQQFNPRGPSFIPRAFSLTHINLTHRNWTAVGLPGSAELPIVDPRGLLTPIYDGWSLDCWVMRANGQDLVPSWTENAEQKWTFENNLAVETRFAEKGTVLNLRAQVLRDGEAEFCALEAEALAPDDAWLVISLRPVNPEGVSMLEEIAPLENAAGWKINGKHEVFFKETPEDEFFSNYTEGDVYRKIQSFLRRQIAARHPSIKCNAGMSTAAAMFKLQPGVKRSVHAIIPLNPHCKDRNMVVAQARENTAKLWAGHLENHCKAQLPDERLQFLYDAAVRSMLLHTHGKDLYPGPFTYKHFWFRDAAIILHAMVCANLGKAAEKILDSFPGRQTKSGHFLSQDGEWDSNGQALWIMRRYCELTGEPPKQAWQKAILSAANWIIHKRLTGDKDKQKPHAGLLPAGFSAEHLGPNDYYYWDDFWGVEGLQSAAMLMEWYGDQTSSRNCRLEADDFLKSIKESLAYTEGRLGTKAMPSSPYRRLDSACIGSMAAAYPPHVWAADDPRVMLTAEYLYRTHCLDGGFFHEMSHSGINPYLTLAIAQVFLRAGDPRFLDLVQRTAHLATSTGQWPEAIHPQTHGGCMGDGQHIWAAAEWVLMIRNMFVREEGKKLILCSGIFPSWLEDGREIHFGRTLTTWGAVSVTVKIHDKKIFVLWQGTWRGEIPEIEVRLPGYGTLQPQWKEDFVEIALETVS